MKTERIPFDIRYRADIEAGMCKVETRDGRPARIVCWDAKRRNLNGERVPILSLVNDECGEEVRNNYSNGRCFWPPFKESNEDSDLDLFLVPVEQELSDFEKCFERIVKDAREETNWRNSIKADCALLMAQARKELAEEFAEAPQNRVTSNFLKREQKAEQMTKEENLAMLRMEYEKGVADEKMKQEQDICTIVGWVARNSDEDAYFFNEKPTRSTSGQYWLPFHEYLFIGRTAFPSLTWDNNPIEVELTIKRKEESK